MRMNVLGLLFASVIGGIGLASTAGAAPVLYCKDGPGINLITTGCISATGDGIYSNTGGGDPESKVEQAILGATGVAVDISLYGKSDEDAALFKFYSDAALTVEIADIQLVQSGYFKVLDGTDIAYITIKGGNGFALYELDPDSDTGFFTTEGLLNNGGRQPEVSHISFWTVDGDTVVPEPATLALFGASLVGLGLLRRRTA